MGTVIQLAREEEPPKRVRIYQVQPYWLDRGELGAGRMREFRTEREAGVAARALAARYYRVELHVVRGYAGSDCWDEPILLGVFGGRLDNWGCA